MNVLYNAGIALYSAGAKIAARRNPKVRSMLRGQAETLKRIKEGRETIAPEGFDLWVHSASLGEFEQARPIIDTLLANNPKLTILASFFSPSGYEVRKSYHPRVLSVYLPFDTESNADEFIDAASPKEVIFVKYEFWGNFLSKLYRRGIPTFLISSIFRPDQIFFKAWGGQFRKILRCFKHIFVQDERSKILLDKIGIRNVTIAGDTRFDRVKDVKSRGKELPELERFASQGETPTLVVGSSWPEDESLYIPWLLANPSVKAIIAPHEFDNERINKLVQAFPTGSAMPLSHYSELFKERPDSQEFNSVKYIIVDSFGLLSSIYRYGDAAYVGGGFGKSIHNINEAAVYGIPVVFGPNNKKFKEAADLKNCGGGFEVTSSTISPTLSKIFGDSEFRHLSGHAAHDYIEQNLGATDRILHHLSSKNL